MHMIDSYTPCNFVRIQAILWDIKSCDFVGSHVIYLAAPRDLFEIRWFCWISCGYGSFLARDAEAVFHLEFLLQRCHNRRRIERCNKNHRYISSEGNINIFHLTVKEALVVVKNAAFMKCKTRLKIRPKMHFTNLKCQFIVRMTSAGDASASGNTNGNLLQVAQNGNSWFYTLY